MKIGLALIALYAALPAGHAQDATGHSTAGSSQATTVHSEASAQASPSGSGPADLASAQTTPSAPLNNFVPANGRTVAQSQQAAAPSAQPTAPGDAPPAEAQAAPAKQAPAQTAVVPLEQITAQVRNTTSGEIIDAQLINRGGKQVYEVKVLEADGAVKVLYFDATSGQPAGGR